MEITEVRIKLMEDSDDRLQAFCSITFDDCFVVRDLKIIDGSNGPFVAMPSRKLTAHCTQCGSKNHLRSQYCNQCGSRQSENRAPRDQDGRTKLYADIAHPINSNCREMIQDRVIAEFQTELERAKQPGYVSRYDEDYDLDDGLLPDEPPRTARAQIQPAESEPRPPHRPPSQQGGRPKRPRSRRAAADDSSAAKTSVSKTSASKTSAPGSSSQPGTAQPDSSSQPGTSQPGAGGPDTTTPRTTADAPPPDEPDSSEPPDDFGAGIF